jgi:hypothetical protein
MFDIPKQIRIEELRHASFSHTSTITLKLNSGTNNGASYKKTYNKFDISSCTTIYKEKLNKVW